MILLFWFVNNDEMQQGDKETMRQCDKETMR